MGLYAASACQRTLTRGPFIYLITFIVTFVFYISLKLLPARLPMKSSVTDLNGKWPITTVPSCPSLKPNLVLSAIDGAKLQDQIFIFMQSLESALGKEFLSAPGEQQHTSCPPAKVMVKIITPPDVARNLPDGFNALLKRYPSLEFVGVLPELDVPIVMRRFQGFANFVGGIPSSWDKILVCDLDVAFQRNPFNMPMNPGVDLLYFAEWRGLKIGQCKVHVGWFNQCADTSYGHYISQSQVESYRSLDRLCAGSTYGTSMAMAVYLRTMAAELMRSRYECNDQAVHIHIFYSKLLDAKLAQAGLGRAWMVPNEEALFGTVGTTPIVGFNEWGEVLNEQGDVQYAVHQYKTHRVLSQIIWNRYGWIAEVTGGAMQPIPELVEGEEWNDAVSGSSESPSGKLLRFKLGNASAELCSDGGSLCSCKYEDCQMDYGEFAP